MFVLSQFDQDSSRCRRAEKPDVSAHQPFPWHAVTQVDAKGRQIR
jgi:hypothetical protein